MQPRRTLDRSDGWCRSFSSSGIGTAAWDAVFGTWGNAIASAVYLVLLLFELFWWPKRQRQLLGNADRAADIAQEELVKSQA